MKLIGRIVGSLVVIAGLLSAAEKGHSYAYDPWTTMTGEGVLAVNPFLYAPSFSPFLMGGDMVAAYGFTSNVDLFVDLAGVNFTPSFTYNYSWAMIRYDWGGNNILALQASQYAVTPQYHFFYENDNFAFEANLLGSFTYTNFSAPLFGAYLAPVYKAFKDLLYFYVEVDPFYTAGSGFSMNVVPGLWLNLGGAGQVSLACTLANVTGTVSPGVAMWYWITFDTKAK